MGDGISAEERVRCLFFSCFCTNVLIICFTLQAEIGASLVLLAPPRQTSEVVKGIIPACFNANYFH